MAINKEENENKLIIEQYKLYVEMADRVSLRRSHTNKFYISILSALIVIISILFNRNLCSNIMNIAYLAYGIFGIALYILWIINIRSYKQLNSGKFKVISEIEDQLPFQPFKREWEILGGGKDRKRYFRLTRIETYVPLLLLIPYFLIIIYSLYLCLFSPVLIMTPKAP
jgi:hypothetical protein